MRRRANVKERSRAIQNVRARMRDERARALPLVSFADAHLCAHGESALWSSLITSNTVHENSHASTGTLRLLRSAVTFVDSNRARVIRTREQLSVINWRQIN